jgi:hypothetical protein
MDKLSRNFAPLRPLIECGEKLRRRLVGGVTTLLKLGMSPLKDGGEAIKIRELDVRLSNCNGWVNARHKYLAFEEIGELKRLSGRLMDVFKDLKPLVAQGQTLISAPPNQLNVLWDIITSFRTLRQGAHDVSKCANPSGSHAAEVLRKQIVQLRALGMMRQESFVCLN